MIIVETCCIFVIVEAVAAIWVNYVRLDSLGKRIRRQSLRYSRFGLVDFDGGEIVWTLVRVLDLLWIEFVLVTTSGTFDCFGVGSVLKKLHRGGEL